MGKDPLSCWKLTLPSIYEEKTLIVQTGQNVNHQNISWRPEAIPGGPLPLTSEGGSDITEPVGMRGTNVKGHLTTKPPQHGTVEHFEQSGRRHRKPVADKPESTDVLGPNRVKLAGKEPSKGSAIFQPTASKMCKHHFTGELPLEMSGRVRSAGVGDSNAESGDSDAHSAPSLAKKGGVRHHIVASGAKHQHYRIPIISSHCRRVTQAFSLKSHIPFVELKHPSNGRTGRKRSMER